MSVSAGPSIGSAVELRFTVKDTGVGIPVDKQERIFEAFSQVDGSMARKYGGSGLGLAICTKLVGMMSGRIWVESVLQQGSAFHFTAMLQAQDKRPARAAPLQAEELKGLRVLIVDDNVTNRQILTGVARAGGWFRLRWQTLNPH